MVEKLLLDTTYLLPVFGIRITVKDYEKGLAGLISSENLFHYSPLSLIESKWILLSLIRRRKLDAQKALSRFVFGLKTILESGSGFSPTELTSLEIEGEADSLWAAGLDDYFDRMLVANAKVSGMTFVTEDEELLTLAEKVGVSAKDWATLIEHSR